MTHAGLECDGVRGQRSREDRGGQAGNDVLVGHTRQSVQRVADLLVADGLAQYHPNPAHRRAKLLQITTAGHRVLRGSPHPAVHGPDREETMTVPEQIAYQDRRGAGIEAYLLRLWRRVV